MFTCEFRRWSRMWTGTVLFLTVVLVLTAWANPEVATPICNETKLDVVNVPKILNGILYQAVSASRVNEEHFSYSAAFSFEQRNASTLIYQRTIIRQRSHPSDIVLSCERKNEVQAAINDYGLVTRSKFKIMIVAHSDNHVALFYPHLRRNNGGTLLILVRCPMKEFSINDFSRAMLHELEDKCDIQTTTPDFYTMKYLPGIPLYYCQQN